MWDEVRQQHVLLYPEGALLLNETGRRILDLVDGRRTIAEISAVLQREFGADDLEPDVREFLEGVFAQGLLSDAT